MAQSKPPKAYNDFVARYPKLGEAWDLLAAGAKEAGPLDDKTCRLIKLAMAVASQQEGAVHSSVRKSLDMGISREEIEQVIALAPSLIGLPSTVAAFCWARDEFDKRGV